MTEQVLVADYVGDFLAAAERRGVKASSIELYRTVLSGLQRNYPSVDLSYASASEVLHMLDAEHKRVKYRYYGLTVMLVKSLLRKTLSRKEIAEALPSVRKADPAATIEVLSREDRDKLIREAPTRQDRLIFLILDESGGRRGEICRIRLKDVQFDQYSAILQLTGKTGTRRRRVFACIPDLREQINNHPHRDNPNAPLFLNRDGRAYTSQAIYLRVRSLGSRILGRMIHPHQFRHTRATEDSRLFTDREMMKLYGWNRPDMVAVYSHLSMRDIDEKELAVHGFKTKEEIMQPIQQIQECGSCGEPNAPVAIYCAKCGAILPNSEVTGLQKILADPKFTEHLLSSNSFRETFRAWLQTSGSSARENKD